MNKNKMAYELINRLSLKSTKQITPRSRTAQLYCPFHDEKNASMFINMDKGIYHCFSCRRKGTINSLSKELTGKSIYKLLDVRYDEFKEYSKPRFKVNEDFDTVPDIKIKESDFGLARQSALPNTKRINAFLRRRGLTRNVANKFNMFVPQGTVYYNGTSYRDRICIPILEAGRLLSIEGRALDTSNPLKVIYPKGSTVSTLFEYEKLNKNKRLWIVEGLMDLAFLRQDPYFENSTCIFGVNITSRQQYLLKKFSEVVYIRENDLAGEGCVRDLQKINIKSKGFLKIPKSLNGVNIKDIGDFVKAGVTVKQFREQRHWIDVGLVELH